MVEISVYVGTRDESNPNREISEGELSFNLKSFVKQRCVEKVL